MKNSTAKEIVSLLSDKGFLCNHTMKERAWWVQKIAEEEDQNPTLGYCPDKRVL